MNFLVVQMLLTVFTFTFLLIFAWAESETSNEYPLSAKFIYAGMVGVQLANWWVLFNMLPTTK